MEGATEVYLKIESGKAKGGGRSLQYEYKFKFEFGFGMYSRIYIHFAYRNWLQITQVAEFQKKLQKREDASYHKRLFWVLVYISKKYFESGGGGKEIREYQIYK